MKYFYALLACFLCAGPALAQTAPASPPAGAYVDTSCGSWQNDVWVDNGTCTAYVTVVRHDSLTGTITSVQGHLVTLQQTNRQVVVNDQPALDRQQTGKVAKGRQVVAYGYWLHGTFYATAIY
ncbi:MAG: hypothetical protein ABR508_05800 [Candidatus Baltobacteraceae bacterium]